MMKLPYEIYLQIFNLLHKSFVRECFMVCKEWSQPAFQVYFKKVIINGHNTGALKELLYQERYFKYCRWTEKLTVDQESSGYMFSEKPEVALTKEEFLKLVEYFPNLKQIEIRTNSNKSKYTKYLIDLDSSAYLTRLENIIFKTDPFSARPYNLYCSVYYKFRASLTRILLNDEGASVLALQYGGVLNYVSQFRKLTHLTYCNNTEHHTTIYEIQVACPGLTSIELISHYYSPLFQDGGNTFDQSSNLKNLSLSFPNISTSYVGYIANYLPESVEDLSITITEIDLYDWIGQVGIYNVLQLANRMSKLLEASLQCIPDKEYEPDHENMDESKMTIFFKVLNAFKGDKKVNCTASFSDFRSVHNYMRLSGENLSIEYGLSYDDLYSGIGEERVLEFSVPDRNASIIGPEVINNLSFYICTVDTELSYKILEYSLVNCPHLQFVEFKATNSLCHAFTLSNNIDYFRKNKEKYNLSSTSKETVKAVQLKNFIPSQKFIDLLSFYLPGVHTFTCGDELSRRFNNKELHQGYIVDLTRFKRLQIVYFNVHLVSIVSGLNFCFVKFKYMDGSEHYYQVKGKEDTSLELISSEDIQKSKTSSTSMVTFKCEKIERFVLYSSRRNNLFKIYQGVPQKICKFEAYDMRYMVI